MQTKWKLLPVPLVAGILFGCGRTEVERTNLAPPKTAQQVAESTLPVIAANPPELALRETAMSREDSAPQTAPVLDLDKMPPAWERQLAEKSSGLQPKEKARAIFALLPSLPVEALDPATRQAVEKLADADYTATALPVITNPETHGQILSVLFADLLERPDAITLPALLSIARNSDHPFAPAALDDLCLLLKANHSENWPQWDKAIREKLAGGR